MYYIEILRDYGVSETGAPLQLTECVNVTRKELDDLLDIPNIDIRRIKKIRS